MSLEQVNPTEFGEMKARLDYQDNEIKEMKQDIKRLLALANQGKGGIVMLTGVGTIVGAILGALGQHFIFHR